MQTLEKTFLNFRFSFWSSLKRALELLCLVSISRAAIKQKVCENFPTLKSALPNFSSLECRDESTHAQFTSNHLISTFCLLAVHVCSWQKYKDYIRLPLYMKALLCFNICYKSQKYTNMCFPKIITWGYFLWESWDIWASRDWGIRKNILFIQLISFSTFLYLLQCLTLITHDQQQEYRKIMKALFVIFKVTD